MKSLILSSDIMMFCISCLRNINLGSLKCLLTIQGEDFIPENPSLALILIKTGLKKIKLSSFHASCTSQTAIWHPAFSPRLFTNSSHHTSNLQKNRPAVCSMCWRASYIEKWSSRWYPAEWSQAKQRPGGERSPLCIHKVCARNLSALYSCFT